MMDVSAFFKEYDRMCHYHRNGCDCGDCPLIRFIEDQQGTCLEICKRYPEKSAELVENWAKEHPAKTYKSIFLEEFPTAMVDADDCPRICITYIFGPDERPDWCRDYRCFDCWNREAPNE